MDTLLTRRGIVAMVAAGLLFSIAGAQDQPQKPQLVERDPFVNTNYQLTPSPQRPTSMKQQSQDSTSPVVQEQKPAEPTELAAPDVKVTGIVASQGQRQAILQSGTVTRVVTVGEQLSDFRVHQISEKGIVLRHSGHDFEISLESEF